MVFSYNNKEYEVKIIRKSNKNTYIRVRDDIIFVTTNYFSSDRSIRKLLDNNYNSIGKMVDKCLKRNKSKDLFLLFGKSYDIIYGDFEDVILSDTCIKVSNDKVLFKWLDEYIYSIYYEHLMNWYSKYEESIPLPNLKIRKMKTRWGVCNIKNNNITLNYYLFRYDIECLDYVIVHELSHFLEFNHSKKFWKIVEKYCSNYKEIRKKLRD